MFNKKKPSPIRNSDNNLLNASSSSFAPFPNSPSLQNEEGFRYRTTNSSPRNFGNDNISSDTAPLPSPTSPTSTVYDKEKIKSSYVSYHNKLTLAWVTYPIISLLFIILRIANVMSSIQPLVDQIKNKILSSCNALELSTSTLVNLPNLMITEYNKINADGINAIVSRLLQILDLIIFALEQICIWIIITYKSTYRCLLALAINSSSSFLTEATTKLQTFATTNIDTIKSSINAEIQNYNDIINGIKDKVKFVDIPNIQINSLTQLDALAQFPATNTLIPGVDLLKSNSDNALSVNFDGIEEQLINATSIPFELLRSEIKKSNIVINQTLFPQASLFANQDITFCKDSLDLSILDNIANDLIKISYIGIALIVLIIIVLIMINAGVIRYKHKKIESNINIFEIVGLVKSPLWTRLSLRISNFFKSVENKNLVKWFFYYISHKPAVICLIIGISGVIAIYSQLALLNLIKHNYQASITTTIDQFSNNVVNLINSNLESKSKQFSNQSNTEIINIENTLNNNLFSWSNSTITTLNNTLNAAVDATTGFINDVFKDVPLINNLVLELVNCIIFVKIRGIEKGLKFIKDNSVITLPRVNDTILMIDSDNVKGIVDKNTNKILGADSATSDDDGEGINKLFNSYEKGLKSELIVYWTFIAKLYQGY
ncbi:17090_t:CDS:2 [Entrophospora sp. SA101]|nr:4267_t:CDS:2 [Entrophospora sp. SA101]CAJ0751055.1 17090_t:CDS:2 [Entrophospora sp. SA101]